MMNLKLSNLIHTLVLEFSILLNSCILSAKSLSIIMKDMMVKVIRTSSKVKKFLWEQELFVLLTLSMLSHLADLIVNLLLSMKQLKKSDAVPERSSTQKLLQPL